MKTDNRLLIVFFLIFTFLSIIIQTLIINQESFINGSKVLGLILMWLPGIAAIITLLVYKKGLGSIGWKIGAFKYYFISYILPILYFGIPLIICIVVCDIVFSEKQLSLNILLMLTIIPITNILGSLGEEIGWRGFLLPNLYRKFSFNKVSLIIGLIWAVWHFPLIIFTDLNAGSNVWLYLITFSIYTVSITYAYNWIWLKSKSIWAVSLLHGVNNSIALNINSIIEKKDNLFELLSGDNGIITPIICILIAIIFSRLKSWESRINII